MGLVKFYYLIENELIFRIPLAHYWLDLLGNERTGEMKMQCYLAIYIVFIMCNKNKIFGLINLYSFSCIVLSSDHGRTASIWITYSKRRYLLQITAEGRSRFEQKWENCNFGWIISNEACCVPGTLLPTHWAKLVDLTKLDVIDICVSEFADLFSGNDPQEKFILEQIKSQNNDKRAQLVKNRRYLAIQALRAEGSYFSNEKMREREPYLFDLMVGQYLDDKGIFKAFVILSEIFC